MGNMSSKLTDDAMKAAQINLLKYSGLDVETDIEIKRVPVLAGESFVNTIIVGDSAKPILILTHGYNGSVTLFYKSIKSLA